MAGSSFFNHYLIGETLLIRFKPSLKWIDVRAANEIDKQVSNLVASHPGTSLLLNLQHVEMMATIMIGNLVRLQKALQGQDAVLKLCSVKDAVRKTLAFTGLDKKLEMVPDEAAVLGDRGSELPSLAEDSPTDSPVQTDTPETKKPGQQRGILTLQTTDATTTEIIPNPFVELESKDADDQVLPLPPSEEEPGRAQARQTAGAVAPPEESSPVSSPAKVPVPLGAGTTGRRHPRLPLDIERPSSDTLVITLRERKLLDPLLVTGILQFLHKTVDAGESRNLVLDLHEVRFISSTLLGQIAKLRQTLDRLSGRLLLAGLDEDCLPLLRILGADKLVDLCTDKSEALRRLRE
jgi:anti-anti-sigma factor